MALHLPLDNGHPEINMRSALHSYSRSVCETHRCKISKNCYEDKIATRHSKCHTSEIVKIEYRNKFAFLFNTINYEKNRIHQFLGNSINLSFKTHTI